MLKKKIKEILISKPKDVTVYGWVKTVRDQKSFTFIEINDGSTFKNLQVIADAKIPDFENLIKQLTTGTSIKIEGNLVESPGKNQSFELQAKKIEILGSCDAATYPLQKKRHSFEYLRTIAHLRPRCIAISPLTS